jgi:hypothetical protein
MCLDERSCLFVLGAAQNLAVLADVHGVNNCVSQMAGNILRQGRMPAACRELFAESRNAPVSDSSSSGLSDSDESPDEFLVRTHIRRLGIDGKDAHRLGERGLAIGRRSFLRAVKELAMERPPAKSIVPALSRIMTRYEC